MFLALHGLAWAQSPTTPLPDTEVPDNPVPFEIPDFGDPAPAPPPPATIPPPMQPVAPPAPIVTYTTTDRLFFPPVFAGAPYLADEAGRISSVLYGHMIQRYQLVTVDAVPPWPDYSAAIYLLSCPQGQYSGCSMVCGQRVGAVWTVATTLLPGPQGTGNLELSFVETVSGKEVIRFNVPVNGQNDADVLRTVDTFLGRLMAGAFRQVDLRRADTDMQERAKLEAIRRQVMVESLQAMERQQATTRVQMQGVEQQKVVKEEVVEKFKEREEVKPWEKVNLSEGAYVRWQNSGLELPTWRRRSQGRQVALMARATVGGGIGPYAQFFDGRYLIDELVTVRTEQYQLVDNASHADFGAELGFGLTPWLDVTGRIALHNSGFQAVIHQEQTGNPNARPLPDKNPSRTVSYGGRLTIVPWSVPRVRPLVFGGFDYWGGSSFDKLVPGDFLERSGLAPMAPMNQLLVSGGPGAEVTLGRRFDFFARASVDFALSGQRQEAAATGAGQLEFVADTTTFRNSPLGFSVHIGLQMRFNFFDPSGANGSIDTDIGDDDFDDDDV